MEDFLRRGYLKYSLMFSLAFSDAEEPEQLLGFRALIFPRKQAANVFILNKTNVSWNYCEKYNFRPGRGNNFSSLRQLTV